MTPSALLIAIRDLVSAAEEDGWDRTANREILDKGRDAYAALRALFSNKAELHRLVQAGALDASSPRRLAVWIVHANTEGDDFYAAYPTASAANAVASAITRDICRRLGKSGAAVNTDNWRNTMDELGASLCEDTVAVHESTMEIAE